MRLQIKLQQIGELEIDERWCDKKIGFLIFRYYILGGIYDTL